LAPAGSTLSELFAASPRDAGWAGFLLAQLDPARPLLWVQERMAILEGGRVHPAGLGPLGAGLIHVEARDAGSALGAMEEGLRCPALSAVVGELWGDPAALDFTATRRLAVAAERHGVAAFLIRLGGHANLSGARLRWKLASAPSEVHRFDPRAPGDPRWEAELFRARGRPPGRWRVAHDGTADLLPVAAPAGDRALGSGQRRHA
jgi:protein ImuA